MHYLHSWLSSPAPPRVKGGAMFSFKDSQEYTLRRLVRGAVRKSPLTRDERDVTLALVNVWFHHRHGPKGYIHPGCQALAKKQTSARKRSRGPLASFGQRAFLKRSPI